MAHDQGAGFGRYLKRHRIEAGKSLRRTADEIGITHVYLGEVERGLRPSLQEKWWDALVTALPTIRIEELRRMALTDRAVQLDLSQVPPQYQELGLALARRIRKQDLNDAEQRRLMEILSPDYQQEDE